MLEKILAFVRKLIPRKLFAALQPVYHYTLALAGAILYRFPSRNIRIVAVTGTKGKSTTVELTNAILEAAGYKTAVLGTIRFKIGDETRPNLFKMTVPGRFFVQKFLRDSVKAGCQWAVVEMSSEAAKQFRHAFIELDALIFTNLAPEHIESHGSYEKYREAKLDIARALARSRKIDATLVVNADDKEAPLFLEIGAPKNITYGIKDAGEYSTTPEGSTFTFHGETIYMKLPGVFNIMNALGAATFAESQNIPTEKIIKGLGSLESIRGRVEYIREGQPFHVVVDYAHTVESLKSLYALFKGTHSICVLGNTGGGRDKWKRPVMAHEAESYCNEIILTNEDPYDEEPGAILNEMLSGIEDKQKASVILDRRDAIHEGVERAYRRHGSEGQLSPVAVLITGKGTDPFLMGPGGLKTPWDDATVAREEIRRVSASSF